MAIFNEGRGRVIDANPNPLFRLIGVAIVAFLLVILLFASVAKVDSGRVGVLTVGATAQHGESCSRHWGTAAGAAERNSCSPICERSFRLNGGLQVRRWRRNLEQHCSHFPHSGAPGGGQPTQRTASDG